MTIASTEGATVTIHTFKEGVAAAVAHDLELTLRRFALAISDDGTRVSATFDPGSFEVVGTVEQGIVRRDILSAKDCATIVRHVSESVFDGKAALPIRFEGTVEEPAGDTCAIRGELTILGRTKPLAFVARRRGDRWVAEVTIAQPDFGIRPFRAMFGALRIRPDVRVTVSVRALG
ncbi:MAG: YceI family protein [Polyangiaceae bacterium]